MKVRKILALSTAAAVGVSGMAGVVIACGDGGSSFGDAPSAVATEEGSYLKGSGRPPANPQGDAAPGYAPWSEPTYTSTDGQRAYSQAIVDALPLGARFRAVWTALPADGYSRRPYTFEQTFVVKTPAPTQENKEDSEVGTYFKGQFPTPPVSDPGAVGEGYDRWSDPVYKSPDGTATYTLREVDALPAGTVFKAVYTAQLAPGYAGTPHTFAKSFTVKGSAIASRDVVDPAVGTYQQNDTTPPTGNPGALAEHYDKWSAPTYMSGDETMSYSFAQIKTLRPGASFKVVYTAQPAAGYAGAPYTYEKRFTVVGTAEARPNVVDSQVGTYVKGDSNNPPVGSPGPVANGYANWSGPAYVSATSDAQVPLSLIDVLNPGIAFKVVYTANPLPGYAGGPYTYTKNFVVKGRAVSPGDLTARTAYDFYRETDSAPDRQPDASPANGYRPWSGPTYESFDKKRKYTPAELKTLPVGTRFWATYATTPTDNYAGEGYVHRTSYAVRFKLPSAPADRTIAGAAVYYKNSKAIPESPGSLNAGYSGWTAELYAADGTKYGSANDVYNLPLGASFTVVWTANVAPFYDGTPYKITQSFRVYALAVAPANINGGSGTVSWKQTSFSSPTPGNPPALAAGFKSWSFPTFYFVSTGNQVSWYSLLGTGNPYNGMTVRAVYTAEHAENYAGPTYTYTYTFTMRP